MSQRAASSTDVRPVLVRLPARVGARNKRPVRAADRGTLRATAVLLLLLFAVELIWVALLAYVAYGTLR